MLFPKLSPIFEFTKEEEMVHLLLLNGNFIKNQGIKGGKAGIIIYFFSLYRRTKNHLYEDFAFELLDELYRDLQTGADMGFENGLCGIGWTIEYLVRERYIELEEDICLELDPKIYGYLLNASYREGKEVRNLCGILLYLLARIESSLVVPDTPAMFLNKHHIVYTLDKLAEYITPDTICCFIKEPGGDDGLIGEHSLILSVWDYPLLLWLFGQVWIHSILKSKMESFLISFLTPLKDLANLPKHMGNRKLLFNVMKFLSSIKCDMIKEHAVDAMKVLSVTQEYSLDGRIDSIPEDFLFFQRDNII